MWEKRIRWLGLFGILSLISYSSMVIFSPLAYPGYDWLSMAISDLSAKGAPSQDLANQLNALFGPCALICVMGVCLAIPSFKNRALKMGVYSFAMMEWICNVGYTMFPWVENQNAFSFQNGMHLIVTVLVVLLSLFALVLIGWGAKKEGLYSLSKWAFVCLILMLMGPMGTAFFPKSVFGLFERFSTFSAVLFNMILGIYLFRGRFFLGECEH
ncbi:MAG: DUF998 domain-containing protein [Bacillota bacterium]|nr:DUF998 domain-containing protein [Bacillota bacterium]